MYNTVTIHPMYINTVEAWHLKEGSGYTCGREEATHNEAEIK